MSKIIGILSKDACSKKIFCEFSAMNVLKPFFEWIQQNCKRKWPKIRLQHVQFIVAFYRFT